MYFPTWLVAERGFSFADVAIIFLLARLVDALTDVPIGRLVDRHDIYRGWFGLGWMLLLIGGLLLWAASSLLVVFSGLVFVFVGWGAITVPWMALPAAFSVSSHLRFNTARELALLMGTFFGLVLPSVIAGELVLGIAVAFVLLLWSLWVVPKSPETSSASANGMSLRDWWSALLSLGASRLLLLWWLNALANAVPASVLLIYLDRVLGLEQWVGAFLVLYFIAAMLGAWMVKLMARRYDECSLWSLACLVSALAFVPAYGLAAGDGVIFAVVCLITGVCFGMESVLAPLLQTRVVSALEIRVSQSKAASFGLWTATQKLAMGFAVVVAFGLLGVAPGEDAGLEELSSEYVAAVYVAVPVALKLLVSALLVSPQWGGRLQRQS